MLIKDHSHFFKTVATSFRVNEVDGDGDDNQDNRKHHVIFPSNFLQRDRIHKSIEEDGGIGRQLSDGNAAGTQGVGPNFGGVGNGQGCTV